MTYTQLYSLILQRQSFLCIGLDSDPAKIPASLGVGAGAVLEFNKQIINATRELCVAYKPNLAFYEALGAEGWRVLEHTVDYIGDDHLVIADAKRGDIGNTSTQYARAFFDNMRVDAITLSPYMGRDAIEPYLAFRDKWAIVLGLTSNPGSQDFQMLSVGRKKLYEVLIERVASWGSKENLMFVVGATQAVHLQKIRKIVPEHFLLVPGIGSQGGSLEEVAAYGMSSHCGLLVNASRSIIYASEGQDFAPAAHREAQLIQQNMKNLLAQYL